MKRFILLIVALSLLVIPITATAHDITLRWDRNSEADLRGYKLYRNEQLGGWQWDPNDVDAQGNRVVRTGPSQVGQGDLVAIIPVLQYDSTDPILHPAEYTDDVPDGDGHYWYVLTAFDVPQPTAAVPNPVVNATEITGQYNESGYSNEPDRRIDSTPPGPPGGLNIWEVIIAFLRKLWSIFT